MNIALDSEENGIPSIGYVSLCEISDEIRFIFSLKFVHINP